MKMLVWTISLLVTNISLLAAFTLSTATARTMVSPPAEQTALPRWDLDSRFGFETPFDEAIDGEYQNNVMSIDLLRAADVL